eukprot:gene481-6891_t
MSKKYVPPPSKEATVIILDLGKSMSEKGSNILEQIKQVTTTFLKLKMVFNPNDLVSIVVAGSSETKNPLYDSDGKCKNVEVIQNFDAVSLELFQKIEDIKEFGKKNSEIFESIELAVELIITKCKKLKYKRRIILISDAGSKFSRDSENVDDLVTVMKAREMQLDVIEVDFGKDVKTEDKTKIKNEKFLKDLIENVGIGGSLSIGDALYDLSSLRSKKTLPRTTFRGNLEITPEMQIKVWSYKKSDASTLPKSTKLSVNSENQETGGKVTIERSYYSLDNPDQEIEEDDRVQAYKYGKSYIPFNKADKEMLKLETVKCLQILGFTEESKVPRHHFIGFTYQVIPEPYDKHASVAFSSLVKALAEMNRVAIVRYCFRDNSAPQLGVLFPRIKESYDCLYYVQLPFSEDLRQYPFPSFQKIKHTNEQLEAAEDLINSMNLMNAIEDEDGEKSEALKPSETYNPIVQHFYDCLHTRVLHPNDELPKMDENIKKTCIPQLSENSFFQKLLQNSKDSIQVFEELFPLKKVEEKKSEKKRYWFAMDKDEEITLESYTNPTKKVKVTTDSDVMNEESEMELIQEKIDLDILSSKTSTVGTKDPIKDFKEMFERKDIDLVDKAIDEMGKIIFKLIQDSIEDQYYEKSVDCIKELRNGCIKEEESDKFNQFLKKLKTSYSKGKRSDFWSLIQKEKISIISQDECPSSDLTSVECSKFLTEEEEIEETIEEPEIEEDDLFGDLE